MNAQTAQSVETEKPAGLKELLRNRNYRFLWLGQIVSDFGDSLTMLALLILVNQITGSAAAIATMFIVLLVPHVTVGLVAGVYVDRLDRKRIMVVSDIVRGVLVLGFVGVALLGTADYLWLMYVLGFLQAMVGTLFTPARSALIPNIVPQQALLSANSISQASRVIFGLLGTASAGLLIGLSNEMWVPFVIDSLTFFASALLIWRIKTPRHVAEPGAKGDMRAVFGQLGDGMKIIAQSRTLVGTLVGMAVTMLGLGAVNVLMVPLIINDMKLPATWFGLIELVQTAAMVLSGGLVAVLAARLKPTSIVSGALSMLGLVIGSIALANNLIVLGIIIFGAGLLITPIQAGVATIMQTSVDNKMRGRVGSALNSVISISQLVSMGVAGTLAEVVGVRNVFLAGGVLTLLAGLAFAAIMKAPSKSNAVAPSGEIPAGSLG
ncbi:MAG: MFS transporter, partial [Chloroflexia bacterium]